MKITFLGTGASEGIPALFCNCKLCREAREKKIFHTRSQVLINDDLLIDFPPDTYYRSLHFGVRLDKIENVLVTHSHSDHLYGEDFYLRGQWSSFVLPVEKITLHGNRAVCDLLAKNGCTESGARKKESRGEVNGYRVYDISSEYAVRHSFETFTAGQYTVTALPAVHMPGEECFNYILQHDGKTVLYAADTGYPSDDVFEFLINEKFRFDAIIVDGTYGLLDCHEGHMNFADNIKLREKFMSIGAAGEKTKCFITHVFHGAAIDLDTLDKAVPEGFEYHADGFSFTV